jgi:hypothetical protein
MKKPNRFDNVINSYDGCKMITGIVMSDISVDFYIKNIDSETDSESAIWITDHYTFEPTSATNYVVHVSIVWSEFKMIATICPKGQGQNGTVMPMWVFTRENVNSWEAFKEYLKVRMTELCEHRAGFLNT